MPSAAPPQFRADFRAGRYDACLGAIRGASGLDEHLLAVTALRRLGRARDALALLAIVEDDVIGAGDDLACGRFCLERGTTLAALDDESAGRSFGLARAFFIRADALAAPAALAELALQEAIAAWKDGERLLALSHLERAAMEPTPETRAWTRRLQGEIAASDLDFRAQLDLEHETLRELSDDANPDAWLEATTLLGLGLVAIDLDERHVAKVVRAKAAETAWTEATAGVRFDVLRALARYESVRGVASEAVGLARSAEECALGDRERLRALVDRARAAERAGASDACERLDEAGRAAEAAAWESTSARVLETLLELADLFAPIDPSRSLAFAARHREARSYTMSLAQQAPTAVARERFWLGSAALGRGERDAARVHLKHAFDFWCTVGFLPNAALAALRLHAIGPSESVRAFLHEHRDRWPGSYLRERMRATL